VVITNFANDHSRRRGSCRPISLCAQMPTARSSESRKPSGLYAHGLTRAFGPRTILDNVNLEVRPGIMAVLEGPNGAGKTTMLRIFATVVRPDAGEARIDGYDVTRDGARVRERIGAAFVNERSIYWRLTGRENLRLFARTRGLSSRAARTQVDALLEELDLVEISSRWVSDLSAGQRQRLIIARAGLGAPTCMLIDEPLRGLDEAGIATMLSFLRAQAARGAAVFIVAPKLDELQAHADEFYRLRDGRVHPWTEDGSDGLLVGSAPA
jgi:ABC-2 type transport system ATP-binding protein